MIESQLEYLNYRVPEVAESHCPLLQKRRGEINKRAALLRPDLRYW